MTWSSWPATPTTSPTPIHRKWRYAYPHFNNWQTGVSHTFLGGPVKNHPVFFQEVKEDVDDDEIQEATGQLLSQFCPYLYFLFFGRLKILPSKWIALTWRFCPTSKEVKHKKAKLQTKNMICWNINKVNLFQWPFLTGVIFGIGTEEDETMKNLLQRWLSYFQKSDFFPHVIWNKNQSLMGLFTIFLFSVRSNILNSNGVWYS